MTVPYIPEGYNAVSPYLMVTDIEAQLSFLKEVFDGEIIERLPNPDGNLTHGEIKIADSVIMMGLARPEYPSSPSMTHIYVADVDAIFQKALDAGGEAIMPPTNQYYGNREAGIKDPQGNQWWMATQIETVSQEEMIRRAAKE